MCKLKTKTYIMTLKLMFINKIENKKHEKFLRLSLKKVVVTRRKKYQEKVFVRR